MQGVVNLGYQELIESRWLRLTATRWLLTNLFRTPFFSPLVGTFDSLLRTEMGLRMNRYRLCEERENGVRGTVFSGQFVKHY